MSPSASERTIKLSTLSNPLVSASTAKRDPKCSSLIRDEKFYIEDGNVVLVADNVAFRVHKSQLARHSTIFRDMFMRFPHLDNMDIFDGCPVVRLPDSSNELSTLLEVFYDHVKLFMDDLWQLTGLLRLSAKYQIEGVHEFALEALSEAYPTTLSLYDTYRGTRPPCGDIVKLAHEIHATNLLPSAYYELCSHSISRVLTLGLSPRMLQNFFLGRDHLATELARFIMTDVQEGNPAEDCKLPAHCDDEWKYLKLEAQGLLSKPDSMTKLFPLSTIGLLSDLPYVDAMCWSCRRRFRATVQAERNNIWSSLPSIFNLGSWDAIAGEDPS